MRVGIISCDYDGTLASFYELNSENGRKRFKEEIKIFKNILLAIKTYEELDLVIFSLNTLEGRFEVVAYALHELFCDNDWLVPGLQFLGNDCYFYDIEQHFVISATNYYRNIFKFGDKLTNISNYALTIVKEDTVVSVTHIEDGKDYAQDSLKQLDKLGIDTYIVNTPSGSNRRTMISALQSTVYDRMEKNKYYDSNNK